MNKPRQHRLGLASRILLPDGSPASDAPKCLLRMAPSTWRSLLTVLMQRYPEAEWVSFGRVGWSQTPNGLLLTVAELDPPRPGDVDESYDHVVIDEQYSLRIALLSEEHTLGVMLAHSHPQAYVTVPSSLDDNMDGYYSSYFEGFTGGRPYLSIIVARDESRRISVSGRAYFKGNWYALDRASIAGFQLWPYSYQVQRSLTTARRDRTARVVSQFGDEAAERIAGARVAVIGAGGTGSPAIECLARAGVGELIIVDPDKFAPSNLERIHGSIESDTAREEPKVLLAKRHVQSINPTCIVTAICGALPQDDVIRNVAAADLILGCTDKMHSRLAMADIGRRYAVPVLDCGVTFEGCDGRVTGQIIELTNQLPESPCPYCRGVMDDRRVTQELMSPAERAQRVAAAAMAQAQGNDPNAYWLQEPQLNTVGYLTTVAGGMIAGAAIGLISGRFSPQYGRLQMNLSQPEFGPVECSDVARDDCGCRRALGWADQGAVEAYVTAPNHWSKAAVY